MALQHEADVSTQHEIDINTMGKKVKSLSSELLNLSRTNEFDELLLIIKRPGWTTPAEFIFASSIIDSMMEHTQALAKLKVQLLKGSIAVNAKK